jgi:hypothetical protein
VGTDKHFLGERFSRRTIIKLYMMYEEKYMHFSIFGKQNMNFIMCEENGDRQQHTQ